MTANHPEDLVARPLGERLREYLKLKYMGNCKCGNCQLVPVEVVAEAAATITSLIGERDALRTALIAAGRAAGAGLSDAVSSEFLSHVPGEVAATIRNRDETIAALRAALEPFSTAYEASILNAKKRGFDEAKAPDEQVVMSFADVPPITVGMFRSARAAARALASPHQEGTGT